MINKKDLEGVTASGTDKSMVIEKQRIGNTSVYWEITEDGTLIVSGKGDPCIAAGYEEEDVPWYEFKNSIKSIIIEKGVTPKSVSFWFSGCTSLVEAPVIPKGVKSCAGMFYGCTSLVEAPVIPEGVEYCDWMFYDCTSLKKAPVIPKRVKNCGSMFYGCTSLKEAPVIPEGVEKCADMFGWCTSLEKAPVIPEGAVDCSIMFYGCTSLKRAPAIPKGVKDCTYMFKCCTSLSGEVFIYNKPKYYAGMFDNTTLPISVIYGGDCTKELAEEIASEYSNVSVKPSVSSQQ